MTKKAVIDRLKTVEGHTRGLQRMVESGYYCVDILRQVLAVQRALDRVNAIILENHLQTCVTTAIRGELPSEREQVIHELVALFTGPSLLPSTHQTAQLEGEVTGCGCPAEQAVVGQGVR
jgi:CsoR family transcriptional regulator, copper-sensing transcriptional repressor